MIGLSQMSLALGMRGRLDGPAGAGSPIFDYKPIRDGLTPAIGTLTTAIPCTNAWVTDHEGLLRQCAAGELGFEGGRRVANLVASSDAMATQNVTTIAGTYVFSMTGTGSVAFSGTATDSITGAAGQRKAVTLTTTAGTLTMTVTGTVVGQLENVTGQADQNPGEHVSSSFTKYGVAGVAWFDYANGNTVSGGVVTEAKGAAFASEPYPLNVVAVNRASYGRDLTNAAWTKTNTTAALTQVGADGQPNTGNLITATAANGTCTQTITLASGARCASFLIKRVSGTGNVQITIDGSSWTTVTLTSAYALHQVTATVTNPVFGVRLVTSGDSIAVDFAQLEDGTTATGRISTTTAAVTRAAAVWRYDNSIALAVKYAGSCVVRVKAVPSAVDSQAAIAFGFSGSHGMLYQASALQTWYLYNGASTYSNYVTVSHSTPATVGASWSAAATNIAAGGTAAAPSAGMTMQYPGGSFGQIANINGYPWYGGIIHTRIYARTLTAAQLASMTT